MNLIHNLGIIVVFIVGIEHIGICLLEMFASSETQAHVFDMAPEFTKQSASRISMANQGIYNGMLGLLIILVFFIFNGNTLTTIWQLLMGFIVIVAAYGGFTATKKIFLVQMTPALVALILISIS